MTEMNEQLTTVLHHADVAVIEETGERNSSRTELCLPIGLYPRFAREGWPDDVREHVRSCQYCQNRRAGMWYSQCPGWRTLYRYLNDGSFVDRLAVDRHLAWDKCYACAAKVQLLKGTAAWHATVESWVSIQWDSTAASAHAADGTRKPVWIPIRFEDPAIELTVKEIGGNLHVKARAEGSSYAGRMLDVRLTGEVEEVRWQLELTSQGAECVGNGEISVGEQQLRDFGGEVFVSLHVGDIDQGIFED